MASTSTLLAALARRSRALCIGFVATIVPAAEGGRSRSEGEERGPSTTPATAAAMLGGIFDGESESGSSIADLPPTDIDVDVDVAVDVAGEGTGEAEGDAAGESLATRCFVAARSSSSMPSFARRGVRGAITSQM